jgi:hypothetical protein
MMATTAIATATIGTSSTIGGACAFLLLLCMGAGGGLFYCYRNNNSHAKKDAAKKTTDSNHVDDEIGVAPGQLTSDDCDSDSDSIYGYRYSESPRSILEKAMSKEGQSKKADVTDSANTDHGSDFGTVTESIISSGH